MRDNAPPLTLDEIKAATPRGAEAIETAVGQVYLDSLQPPSIDRGSDAAASAVPPVSRAVARSVGGMVLETLEGQKKQRQAVEVAVGNIYLDSLGPPASAAPRVPPEVSRSVGGMVLDTLDGQRLQRQATERTVGDMVLQSLHASRADGGAGGRPPTFAPQVAAAVGSAYLGEISRKADRGYVTWCSVSPESRDMIMNDEFMSHYLEFRSHYQAPFTTTSSPPLPSAALCWTLLSKRLSGRPEAWGP